MDPTTPKTLAPLFESSLTEDPMTAEQSKQKTSNHIYGASAQKTTLKMKTYPSKKGKQLETLQRNDASIWYSTEWISCEG